MIGSLFKITNNYSFSRSKQTKLDLGLGHDLGKNLTILILILLKKYFLTLILISKKIFYNLDLNLDFDLVLFDLDNITDWWSLIMVNENIKLHDLSSGDCCYYDLNNLSDYPFTNSVLHLNARSLKNKLNDNIEIFLKMLNSAKALVLTETWFKGVSFLVNVLNYSFVSSYRVSSSGGSVGMCLNYTAYYQVIDKSWNHNYTNNILIIYWSLFLNSMLLFVACTVPHKPSWQILLIQLMHWEKIYMADLVL